MPQLRKVYPCPTPVGAASCCDAYRTCLPAEALAQVGKVLLIQLMSFFLKDQEGFLIDPFPWTYCDNLDNVPFNSVYDS
jgi:hypothetical protein